MAVVRFTVELSHWEPEAFVRAVLLDWLHVAEAWVGANFLFGRERTGNFSLLRTLGTQYGFRTEKIDPVRYKEFVVSSTRIRRLVSEGRVDEAAALLGRHYILDGTVVPGDARGRLLGFPTANLDTANELIPPHGVYATLALLDGRFHRAVTNIGVRPTFGGADRPTIETHLLDFSGELYGRRLQIAFAQRLRDERTFAGREALQRQIESDISRTRDLFQRVSL
jgi:riboflavin kinase/FMN adenylyltransferase